MKHKAQECFERIYQQDYEVFDSSCLVAVEDSDMRYEEDCDTIQDLIDCQLTVEEIEMLQDALLVIKHYRKSKYHDIKHKLMKQKEMWVNDDETN